MASHPGEIARVLILVGLILQAVLVGILVLAGFSVGFVTGSGIANGAGIFFVLAGAGLVWVILVYALSYTPAANAEYESATVPTLVLGILSISLFVVLPAPLLSGFTVLPGALYLVGCAEFRSAIQVDRRAPKPVEEQSLPRPPQYVAPAGSVPHPQYATPANALLPLPPGTKYCKTCGQPTVAQARVCRNCGAPLSSD
jgi:hypothetical protein